MAEPSAAKSQSSDVRASQLPISTRKLENLKSMWTDTASIGTLNRFKQKRTQSNATGFLFSKFLACSNANAICSTPQSS